MRQDRFLFSILVAVGALVLLSLALFFVGQGAQAYTSEDTPQGIVQNYILALQKEDYERAYGYLSDGAGKPDIESFRRLFLASSPDLYEIAVQIEDVQEAGQDAYVELVLLSHNNGPFADIHLGTTRAILRRDPSGAWKLTTMPYPYWGMDWYSEESQAWGGDL